ncbi:50S ribosomal protein L4 [Haliangium sp. UPWRP_2]|uniref:50S ribosomal protein L4 n=1 Tax=Haliangium sp. UPWRP_2 TaxID=1931276 RepID=UPI000D0D83E9|nr:50S ribosomal protein L4 [Haliangium sp. UPWRP_2]PSM32427.1 50S ribosomal protein L4 [Haliangium sp. UPWRP_2]
MATFDVVNAQGQKIRAIELDDSVFSADIKEHVLWEVVKQQLAARRQGTHSTLHRGEVRGGGKKPYRQKGTGQARQGSSRAPNHAGGAKVFSPKPRDYEYSLPKKVKQAALRSALSLRAKEKKLIILEDVNFEAPKTKQALALLGALGSNKALLVASGESTALAKSMRNLASAKYLAVEGLNTYDILKHPSLILTEKTAKAIESRLSLRSAS